MKIAVVTPTLGDRPEFLKVLEGILEAQTIQPDTHIVVDDKKEISGVDVTWRYKLGIARAIKYGADVILTMEDDDWYSTDYIYAMCSAWKSVGKPQLFGIGTTIYYHLGLRKYAVLNHSGRASMMSMLIRPDLQIDWCRDDYPYLDFHMWVNMRCGSKQTGKFGKTHAIGIKHNIGAVAGSGHRETLSIYKDAIDDPKFDFLAKHVTPEQLDFYRRIVS